MWQVPRHLFLLHAQGKHFYTMFFTILYQDQCHNFGHFFKANKCRCLLSPGKSWHRSTTPKLNLLQPMLTWSKCSLLFLLFIFFFIFFDFSNISISSGFRLLRDDPTSWQQVKYFGPLTRPLQKVPWSLLWWSDHQCSSSLKTHALTWFPDQVLVPRRWPWPSRHSVCPAGQSDGVWMCHQSKNPQWGQRCQMASVRCLCLDCFRLAMYLIGSSPVSQWLWHSTRALLMTILASAVRPPEATQTL